ncbi:hypothetical protein COBT_003115 [Conglomerata obtusa]
MLSILKGAIACFYSQSKDTGDYTYYKKFEDPEYILQVAHLEKCTTSMTELYKTTLYNIYNIIKNEAYNNIVNKLTNENIARFNSRNLIDCVSIIANHKANKIMCKNYRHYYMDYDLIEGYVLLEYLECLKQKNSKYVTKVEFDLPINLESDIDYISEQILENI